jgi:hypothetical protein
MARGLKGLLNVATNMRRYFSKLWKRFFCSLFETLKFEMLFHLIMLLFKVGCLGFLGAMVMIVLV